MRTNKTNLLATSKMRRTAAFSYFCIVHLTACFDSTAPKPGGLILCDEQCKMLDAPGGLTMAYLVLAREQGPASQADWNTYNGKRTITVVQEKGETVFSIRDSGVLTYRAGEMPSDTFDVTRIGQPMVGNSLITHTPPLIDSGSSKRVSPRTEFGIPFNDLDKWQGQPWCCYPLKYIESKKKVKMGSDSLSLRIFTDTLEMDSLIYLEKYGLVKSRTSVSNGGRSSLAISFSLETFNGIEFKLDSLTY